LKQVKKENINLIWAPIFFGALIIKLCFVYWVETAAIRISEITAMARYNKVLAGGSDSLECADLAFIYVKRDGSTDATLHFYFRTI
jgi:hypothetical protein